MTAADPGTDDRAVRARCIAVTVAGTLYGLRVEEVQEVIGMRPLTRVFHAPLALAGVTSLRGEVLPVLDLAVLLGAPPAARTQGHEARIVVVRESDGERRRAGVLVDGLGGLRDVPEVLAPVPSTAGEAVQRLVIGVIPTPPPCSVVAVRTVLESPELGLLAGAESA